LSGVSIETTLELWASSLRDVKARMRPLFTQERVAASASLFLDGLLGSEPRKTGWMRAEAAGDPGPWRQQAILGRGRWDADALRDIVREYALETLAEPDAVLVLDETGFLKKGAASCSVARQYTGSAGKIANCQVGVFAAYVSRHGHGSRIRTNPGVFARLRSFAFNILKANQTNTLSQDRYRAGLAGIKKLLSLTALRKR
jgi:SRSO17 transposase